MDLDEWLWKEKISITKFADMVKVSNINLHYIITRKSTARLPTAIKILKATKGEVELENLVSEKHCKMHNIKFVTSR